MPILSTASSLLNTPIEGIEKLKVVEEELSMIFSQTGRHSLY